MKHILNLFLISHKYSPMKIIRHEILGPISIHFLPPSISEYSHVPLKTCNKCNLPTNSVNISMGYMMCVTEQRTNDRLCFVYR